MWAKKKGAEFYHQNQRNQFKIIEFNQGIKSAFAPTFLIKSQTSDQVKNISAINEKGVNSKNCQVMLNTQKIEPQEEQQMKYLTKRSDGRWQGSKVINGKRVFVYAKTQLECNEKLRNLSKIRKKSPKAESVANFSIYYLKTYKDGNVAPRTYNDYLAIAKKYLNLATPLNKVTVMQLQELLNKLPATRIRTAVYQLVRQIFRKAHELDLIHKDVSQFLEKGKVAKADRRALNLEEQRALVESLKDDIFSRRVMFYLCTGARPSEIASIKKDELRPGWVKINGTKTAKAVRWVKISQKMYEVILNAPNEFFKFDSKKFRIRLQKTCEKAGIRYDVDLYSLRHTFATNLYIIGVAEKDRQEYMGHVSGSAMTNDVYTTFTPDVRPENIYDIYGEYLPKF